MEKSNKKSFAEFLSNEEQTKVLENVINKGLFDQVVPLAAKGYAFSLFIFDLLRTCGRSDIMEEVWNMAFRFHGSCKYLTSYVKEYKGTENAARFIKERRDICPVWNACYSYFTDDMLEAVQDWKALVSRGNVEALIEHRRYDDIISAYHRWSSGARTKAAKVLREQKLEQRIIELRQYEWLAIQDWQPEGAKCLIAAGKTEELVNAWTCCENLPEHLRCLCDTEEGREMLCRKNKYKWLYDAGHPEYMVKNKKWVSLARFNRFDLIDWQQVDKGDKTVIIRLAVRNKRWDFLLKNRQYKVLLKHGKVKLLLGL